MDLSANLATWMGCGMDVHVRLVGPDHLDEICQRTTCQGPDQIIEQYNTTYRFIRAYLDQNRNLVEMVAKGMY